MAAQPPLSCRLLGASRALKDGHAQRLGNQDEDRERRGYTCSDASEKGRPLTCTSGSLVELDTGLGLVRATQETYHASLGTSSGRRITSTRHGRLGLEPVRGLATGWSRRLDRVGTRDTDLDGNRSRSESQ